MTNNKVKKPIGIPDFVTAINNCDKANNYSLEKKMKFMHYIIFLDSGNGRTVASEYAVNKFMHNNIVNFSGTEDCIEYKLDGTLSQLKSIVGDIRSRAVYANYFEGVIAMDITKLASCVHESQIDCFFNMFDEFKEHAAFLFFIPCLSTKNIEILVKKIKKHYSGINVIPPHLFTLSELAEIAERNISEHGIRIEAPKETHENMLALMSLHKINKVKDAVSVSETVMEYVDFNESPPVLTSENLKKLITNNVAVKGEKL